MDITDSEVDSKSETDVSDYESAPKRTASKKGKGVGNKRKAKKEVPKPQGNKKLLRYRESYGQAPTTPPLSANADDQFPDLPTPTDETAWAVKEAAKSDPLPKVVTIQVNGNAGVMGTINLNLADILTSAGLTMAISPVAPASQHLMPANPITAASIDETSDPDQHPADTATGFMKLPAELRDRIYRLLMVGKKPVDFDSPSDFNRSAALLRTCKTIHEEATEVLYGQNSFHFARTRKYRGKYWEQSWYEVGYQDVRRFLEAIGPVNISKMKYISFIMTDGQDRTMASDTHVRYPKFVNDPHLHLVLRFIGQHTTLEKFGFMFAGRSGVGAFDFHLLNALTDIKCYQLDFIRRFRSSRSRVSDRIEKKVREIMVVKRADGDKVNHEKNKFKVPMVYTNNDLIQPRRW